MVQHISSLSLFSFPPLVKSIELITSLREDKEREEKEQGKREEETSKEPQPEKLIKVVRKKVKEQKENPHIPLGDPEDHPWDPNPDIRPGNFHPWEDEFREDRWTTTTQAVQDTLETQEKFTNCLEG